MYALEWVQSARDELATIWMAASSSDRKRITRASYLLEETLKNDLRIRENQEKVMFEFVFRRPWRWFTGWMPGRDS